MRTRITELFNIKYPVMSAPMTNHSGGRLAAAVSQAGGLGSFGGIHPAGVDRLLEQVRLVRSQTDNPLRVWRYFVSVRTKTWAREPMRT